MTNIIVELFAGAGGLERVHDVPYAVVLPIASVVTIAVIFRYGSDAVLRLVAGIAAIVAKDPKRSRAERALDVLKALRGGDPPRPPDRP